MWTSKTQKQKISFVFFFCFWFFFGVEVILVKKFCFFFNCPLSCFFSHKHPQIHRSVLHPLPMFRLPKFPASFSASYPWCWLPLIDHHERRPLLETRQIWHPERRRWSTRITADVLEAGLCRVGEGETGWCCWRSGQGHINVSKLLWRWPCKSSGCEGEWDKWTRDIMFHTEKAGRWQSRSSQSSGGDQETRLNIRVGEARAWYSYDYPEIMWSRF